jgi:hypothetical protein
MKNYFFSLIAASMLMLVSCTNDAELITPTTESAALLASPAVVPTLNTALEAVFPNAITTQWEVAGVDLYATTFLNDGVNSTAYFQAADGAFLMLNEANSATMRGGKKHCKGDTILLATVPASAQTYVTTNYAGSTITKACKDTIGGIVTYRLHLSNPTTLATITLVFDANWVFVKAVTKTKGKHGQHTEVAILISDIAASATSYIATNYVGYSITSAEKETDSAGIVTYEVKISNGTTKVHLVFDANWVFVKAKIK